MNPKVIIRLGSHAEKEYLLKTVRFWDGLIIGANLVEATPAATASLIVKAGGKKQAIPYYVDPMTYAFGTYTYRQTNEVREDLDWIKSEQKVPNTDRTVRAFKRSYKQLAQAFGTPFEQAMENEFALTPKDLSDNPVLELMCESVVEYQLNRIKRELMGSTLIQPGDVPEPAAVFAPYFYVEPTEYAAWIDVNLELAEITKEITSSIPVHAILCVDHGCLSNDSVLEHLKTSLPQTGVDAVWLWFSRFREDSAPVSELASFRELVETLAKQIRVFNLHGGFYSLALTNTGFSGISHGIGYGEQKDVVPVVGQATPMVRYYLPDIHKRVSVPYVERCFDELGIKQPIDFQHQVCDCVVCKGVISQNIHDFADFGRMHRAHEQSKRDTQTPAAAKKCRYHFLLNRIRERDEQKSLTMDQTREHLQMALRKWGSQLSLVDEVNHLQKWIQALS